MHEDVSVLVVDGVVREVSTSRAAVSMPHGCERVDLGDVLLVPAFVNAHAHLELSGMHGKVPPGESFDVWIRGVISARRAEAHEGRIADTRAGSKRLLETGTTLVGDIDSSGAVVEASRDLPLAVRRYREALDAGDAARTNGAIERVDSAVVVRERFHEGLSPHAPYTVSAGLWSALGRLARAREWPVAIHFAETREEGLWLEQGTGPFGSILAHSPRASGLDSIESAGLLNRRTLLVHANHATPEERERIRASGAGVVHCPGAHLFFGRDRFDAESWLALGVPLALGTDSLASNADLDMGREMALFAASHASLAPELVFRCASANGAAVLDLAGKYGEIRAGAEADFNTFELGSSKLHTALEALVHGSLRLHETYASGSRVRL